MKDLFQGPFFFIGLCLIVYLLACRLQRRTRQAWLNPLLVSIVSLIGILSLLKIPYAQFKEGTSAIAMMLTPATCVLAIPMVNQRKILKQNLTAILIDLDSLGYLFMPDSRVKRSDHPLLAAQVGHYANRSQRV